MERTAGTMETTQRVVARGADGVRVSIENASAAMNEQRSFTETALGEIRATLELLSMGLGESLQRALHSVDDTLEHTVGRLRDTIHESNDTIDRMTVPVRAAEGTSRELHTALERVRSEITGLGDWLGQTAKPLRTSLTHLEDKTGDFARALIESGEQAQAVDKTMDALRGEIHEEGRRFRASVQELGRFLAQNAEALRALERTTAEGAERMGRDVLPELEAELDLLDPPVSGPPARDPIVDATAAGTPQASPPEAPSREPSQVEPSVQAEQPADSVAGATAPAPAPQREPDSAVPPELANATSRPIPGGSPAYEPDGKAGGDRIEADRTVVADPIEAFATETKSEAALASGRRLGPDPYTRMGTDRAGQAHELVRKRQALGATASDPPPELGAGQRPTFNGSDDLTLSGLLGKRSATADPPASPPSAPASSPDPTSESDDEPADPGEEPGSEATSPSATPRTWRLLGRE
jgi:ABC-type transporter Mla subunit MlaD